MSGRTVTTVVWNALIVAAVLIASMAALVLAAQVSSEPAFKQFQSAKANGQLWTVEYPIIHAKGLPLT